MKMKDEELRTYTEELIRWSGTEEEGFLDRFLDGLNTYPSIRDEYVYYLTHGSYLCEYTIAGCSIADIVIWQMDNFKALLDNKESQIKDNPYRMTLAGFDTMMKMEKDPERYISKIRSTTGTDYLGKY